MADSLLQEGNVSVCVHSWQRFAMWYPRATMFWRVCRKCGERRA